MLISFILQLQGKYYVKENFHGITHYLQYVACKRNLCLSVINSRWQRSIDLIEKLKLKLENLYVGLSVFISVFPYLSIYVSIYVM